uniref:trypsin n=1 Tax=Stegastes partitus TaxID=144197 RepID=A0A3B4ZT19_9TELE
MVHLNMTTSDRSARWRCSGTLLNSKWVLTAADCVAGLCTTTQMHLFSVCVCAVPLPNPETLQQLKIPIMPQTTCKATYPQLTSSMLCAGVSAGGKDACTGDSGSPLVCRAAGRFVQVGIMSYGSSDGCGLPGKPGVYTRVSKYLRFITFPMRNYEKWLE